MGTSDNWLQVYDPYAVRCWYFVDRMQCSDLLRECRYDGHTYTVGKRSISEAFHERIGARNVSDPVREIDHLYDSGLPALPTQDKPSDYAL